MPRYMRFSRRDIEKKSAERLDPLLKKTSSKRAVIDIVLDSISEVLAIATPTGEHILEIRGFGSFMVRVEKSHVGHNPKNPDQKIEIPERTVVRFKPSPFLKKRVQ